MDWVNVIQETLRYLEKNLLTVQGPKEVALAVHVSASYLQTSFQMITGFSISEYIRNRRLYLAAMDLLSGDAKVIDISEKYGYETPESFTKAFSRFHDATPNEIKKKKKPVKAFQPLKLSFSVKGGDEANVRIEKTDAFKLIGAAEVFDNATCFQKIPGYASEFIFDELKHRRISTEQSHFYGFSLGECELIKNEKGTPWLYDFDQTSIEKITFAERFIYLCGTEYHGGEVPEGMHVIDIPETLWAKFRCRDEGVEDIQNLRRYIFVEWLFENEEYDVIDEYNTECYSLPNEDGKGTHHEIWIPIRRRGQ